MRHELHLHISLHVASNDNDEFAQAVRLFEVQCKCLFFMQAMFAWVATTPSGLFAEEREIIDDADSAAEKSIEDKYAGHASKHCLLDCMLIHVFCHNMQLVQDPDCRCLTCGLS